MCTVTNLPKCRHTEFCKSVGKHHLLRVQFDSESWYGMVIVYLTYIKGIVKKLRVRLLF